LDLYDPRFGEAFYTGAWHEGFDHAEALATLSVPTVLMHANWQMDQEGTTLLGAMDDEEAARARKPVSGVGFRRVDAGHAVHFEKPALFTDIVTQAAFGTQRGACSLRVVPMLSAALTSMALRAPRVRRTA